MSGPTVMRLKGRETESRMKANVIEPDFGVHEKRGYVFDLFLGLLRQARSPICRINILRALLLFPLFHTQQYIDLLAAVDQDDQIEFQLLRKTIKRMGLNHRQVGRLIEELERREVSLSAFNLLGELWLETHPQTRPTLWQTVRMQNWRKEHGIGQGITQTNW